MSTPSPEPGRVEPAPLDATREERLRILQDVKSIALVGVSANPLRSSNFVATYLARTGLRVLPVNPVYREVLGLPCYPSLRALPEVPDIVVIFRAPDHIPEVVDEAIAVGARGVWFQLGLVHDAAARAARDAGLVVVQNRCFKIEHARFSGGLRLAGIDTGVISSKRRRPL